MGIDNTEKQGRQKAEQYGKVAKLPKNTDAKTFMEKIKIPRNKLWYVLVEKQDNELHMIKYNQEGVNTVKFVSQLKEHYINQSNEPNIRKMISEIEVIGNDSFSVIKNIPDISVVTEKKGINYDKKLLSKMMEDLIILLK